MAASLTRYWISSSVTCEQHAHARALRTARACFRCWPGMAPGCQQQYDHRQRQQQLLLLQLAAVTYRAPQGMRSRVTACNGM